jgi:hypothetical protein
MAELTGYVKLTQVLPNAVQYDIVGVVDDESEFVGEQSMFHGRSSSLLAPT